MPRCTCKHAGDLHPEVIVHLDDGDESMFPCAVTICPCLDYEAELVEA